MSNKVTAAQAKSVRVGRGAARHLLARTNLTNVETLCQRKGRATWALLPANCKSCLKRAAEYELAGHEETR